ncbi:MAG: PQQ-dependent sugar dehydrogenase [Nocardioides sp.]|uniref:PQQ-dependent sugar dehydrogenase n=1 Tax=Nocardioides sp. TaxID=35761 RepID=UPI0023A59029|nr:PQQ-dependent sugar dehydrogenase [Nocardioides sp.]MDE0775559.1 PQQ-dependent sugar dehydrogenase [Nocardioides sp.]
MGSRLLTAFASSSVLGTALAVGSGPAIVPVAPAAASHAVVAPTHTRASETQHGRAPQPSLVVRTKVSGLTHAWDVKQIDGRRLLITERDPARLTIARRNGSTYDVRFPAGRVWTSGETGLMGLEVDPGFARNDRFYTCSGWLLPGGGHDVRVNAWKLNAARTRARLVKPLLTGLPSTSGRHGGCRLLISSDGALVVGTGDAAVGTNPQDQRSLGGKTLRLHRKSGKPWSANPFIDARSRTKRYVLTYGHRNVQGLAERRDGSLWAAEHGPDVDDEVNAIVPGGDYGWNPVPGYNESVPMTDQGLPGRQVEARWSSGSPTLATSGAGFVAGKKWGRYRGALAVAALKSERVLFLKFDRAGRNPRVFAPAALQRYGRLRTVTQLGNNNLLVATDGVDGQGKILLVKPRR